MYDLRVHLHINFTVFTLQCLIVQWFIFVFMESGYRESFGNTALAVTSVCLAFMEMHYCARITFLDGSLNSLGFIKRTPLIWGLWWNRCFVKGINYTSEDDDVLLIFNCHWCRRKQEGGDEPWATELWMGQINVSLWLILWKRDVPRTTWMAVVFSRAWSWAQNPWSPWKDSFPSFTRLTGPM